MDCRDRLRSSPANDGRAPQPRVNKRFGGVNGDTEGCRETIAQAFLIGVRAALARSEGRGLADV